MRSATSSGAPFVAIRKGYYCSPHGLDVLKVWYHAHQTSSIDLTFVWFTSLWSGIRVDGESHITVSPSTLL